MDRIVELRNDSYPIVFPQKGFNNFNFENNRSALTLGKKMQYIFQGSLKKERYFMINKSAMFRYFSI